MLLVRFPLAALSAVLALCGWLDIAGAQTPPAPAEPPAAPPPIAVTPQNLSVMVVDFETLFRDSKAAKAVRTQIEQKRAEYIKELSPQDRELTEEQDALIRQQGSLSPEAFNKRVNELRQKKNLHDRDVQSKGIALEKSNSESLQKIQNTAMDIIQDIGKKRKVNLVFQRGQLVFFDPAFDVTDEVLQRLDEQLPTMTVDFVAPVASAATATPASAAAGQPPAAAPAPATGKPKRK
ncbi:MAG: OmpH family outer membrane protein [Alphaproteobacteria bacterium]|nr:OmpH family outer membrane protein [Alphaproteobacteria bacterium]MBV9862715.1 OmpH family outer membrane protein [Alphaproteobacteria bacterium]